MEKNIPIKISSEIEHAIKKSKPIVILESAVLTHGLPMIENGGRVKSQPESLLLPVATALAVETAVREAGAVPATVGVKNKKIIIGLQKEDLLELAIDPNRVKVSPTNFARTLAKGRQGGTTVGGTLVAIQALQKCHYFLKPVMSTGGIGGVHRNWSNHLDISADLIALSKTPCLVICAGAKSILDKSATIEMLETLGVPALGWKCDKWPVFIEKNQGNEPSIDRVDNISEVVSTANTHWTISDSSLILARQLETNDAINPICLNENNVTGKERTPALLNLLAEKSKGKSLNANIKLLTRNALLAASCASKFN